LRLAVTGARGRLGGAFTATALDRGHDVVGIDISPPGMEKAAATGAMVEVTADVTEFGEVAKAVDGCDGLVHLAAYAGPYGRPSHVVHNQNVVASYNALLAAAEAGIRRVCVASSVNAIGGVYSRRPRYDYFPLDEAHPTYTEDPYSLSKWICEVQAASVARRFDGMTVGSLRFHRLVADRGSATKTASADGGGASRDLWGYTTMVSAVDACLAVVQAGWVGHEVFYVVAPRTAVVTPTAELCRRYYPGVPLREDLAGNNSLYNCTKAAELLGWSDDDD
jgi:nucleoside-diphosphate-sugar epimerase